jgi:hypothetical protein
MRLTLKLGLSGIRYFRTLLILLTSLVLEPSPSLLHDPGERIPASARIHFSRSAALSGWQGRFLLDSAPNPSIGEPVLVPLTDIPTDEAAQARVHVRTSTVRDYAAAMIQQVAEGGLRFPPVLLFSDGRHYWLGDGYHRVLAARKAGLTALAAEVRPGTQRDALLYGISANSAHGLPRTRADRRKAVALLLADAEWSQWSDREIARRCQVDHQLVSRMRRCASGGLHQIQKRKVQRGGAIYEMDVPASKAAGAVPSDALGLPVPEARAKLFAALSDFYEAKELFERLAQVLDRIAQGPAGELYRQELVRTADNGQPGFACPALRICRDRLVASEPYCGYCPNCYQASSARPYPSCKSCGGRGWTTRAAFERCRASDQQHILNLRSRRPE